MLWQRPRSRFPQSSERRSGLFPRQGAPQGWIAALAGEPAGGQLEHQPGGLEAGLKVRSHNPWCLVGDSKLSWSHRC